MSKESIAGLTAELEKVRAERLAREAIERQQQEAINQQDEETALRRLQLAAAAEIAAAQKADITKMSASQRIALGLSQSSPPRRTIVTTGRTAEQEARMQTQRDAGGPGLSRASANIMAGLKLSRGEEPEPPKTAA